jgi:integration host factor subunit alpha
LLKITKSRLAAGEDLLISGFGKFQGSEKSRQWGRTPITGNDMILKPRSVVRFRCSWEVERSDKS